MGKFLWTVVFTKILTLRHAVVAIRGQMRGIKRLNRFFIGVNEYDSYEMLTFASWKTKVC